MIYQNGKDKACKTWEQRRDKVEMDWNDNRSDLMSQFLYDQSFSSVLCSNCKENHFDSYYVKCLTCRMKICDKCDNIMHHQQPFHHRFFQNKDTLISLLPTEFIENGELITKSNLFDTWLLFLPQLNISFLKQKS